MPAVPANWRRLAWALLFQLQLLYGQTDFGNSWEDFFSYNKVKDLMIMEEKIYAIADNAAFIYDWNNEAMQKISSVHGLSGKETSSLHFSPANGRFVIGYRTGLLEIVDENGRITSANDMERLNITGEKQVNHITEHEGKLYLSTPFGIVVYDILNLEFGDTYYIDEDSRPVQVYQTAVFNGTIYAATEKGIYMANVNDPNLVDFNNWLQPEGPLRGDFRSVTVFDSRVFTSSAQSVYQLSPSGQLVPIRTYNRPVRDLKASDEYLTVSMDNLASVLNSGLQQVHEATPTGTYRFTLNTALAEGESLFLATNSYGVLKNDLFQKGYEEIHPDGPSSNQVFSITAANNQLWVVYGGYDGAYTPFGKTLGYSHYNGSALEGNSWINQPYDDRFPAKDLVHVTLDPTMENKAYISSWNSGMLVVENDSPLVLWNESNSGLEDLYPEGSANTSIRINGSAFDNRGNLWIANAWVPERVKKLESNGSWKSFDMSSVITNPAFGLSELVIDNSGSVWMGSRRNGALVFNESGERKRALITEATKGSLPDLHVRTLAVDRYNRIWIGTQKGLVIFNDPEGVFDADIYDAEPVIVEDDGIPKKLLGDQPISSIAIDGAENKWFGTETGGILGTNPSGSETLYIFDKDNSPLPSNRIVKIAVDDSTGRVFFATDKGIVAFNSEVSPFGDSLEEVYAYPNPARSSHETVTIDGRNGSHLPKGTNVKILDAAGRLVYETNVDIGQEIKGGKVIWDKTNLRGRRVASGVYIVLLTSPDKSETASTKIAIVN